MSPYAVFLARFAKLKTELSGSNPRNLIWRSKNDPALAKLALDLFEASVSVRRRVKDHAGFVHAHVPSAFPGAFQEYLKNFEEHVAAASRPMRETHAEEIGAQLESLLNDPAARESVLTAVKELSNQNPFDIDEYDGGEVIASALFEAQSLLEGLSADPLFEEKLDEAEQALKAWRFLNESIGLNIIGVFRRWKSIEPIFVPIHVANHHGLLAANSLFSKLKEAGLAFACGCNLATLALCRAILETTLTLHYSIDIQKLPPNAGLIHKVRASSLSQIDRQRFEAYCKLANRVLHGEGAISDESETQASEFLFALKRLIEHAPQKGP